MSGFDDFMTLGEARERLRALVEDGYQCPCCKQFAKVYRRRVNASMAKDLIALYRFAGKKYANLADVRKQSGSRGNREESKLRYWGLVEELPTRRADGGHGGRWRVTDGGEDWLLGVSLIPKYARVYDGRCIGLVGAPVSIVDALGWRFDYAELMGRIV